MEVEYGTLRDIESWMELVGQVRWSFPGLETQEALEEHRQTVLRFMGENRALCVKDKDKIIGVLLFSKKHNMICCLAVDPAYRRKGIGAALLKKALSELDRSKDMTVTTFREKDEKGVAPRALYRRFGFTEGKLLVEFGYPVQEFVLRGKNMKQDMCVACEDGMLNLRVGAIIMKDGKILMVGNERANYLYSVGGRIKFGETAEEAVVREVYEETGVKMEIDRLGFVHENYFYGDAPANLGKLIYEVSFFFYMKVPYDFAPISDSFTEDNCKEFLKWVSPDEEIKMYPTFFKTELKNPADTVRHFVTDER